MKLPHKYIIGAGIGLTVWFFGFLLALGVFGQSRLITVLFGIVYFLYGCAECKHAVKNMAQKQKHAWLQFIPALLTLFHAVLVLAAPFPDVLHLHRFLAVALGLDAAIDIGIALFVRRCRREKRL